MKSPDQEQYERELAERQRQHLENVQGINSAPWRPCMHDQCTSCHGTGVSIHGGACVHGISCPCPKCSPSYCVSP